MSNKTSAILREAIAKVGSQKTVALKVDIDEAIISKFLNDERGLSISQLDKLLELVGLQLAYTENHDDIILIKLLAKKVGESLN